jgi:putative two-component system response regulator
MVSSRGDQLWDAITQLSEREAELEAAGTEMIKRLAMAAELRDDETPRHIQRMSRYCAVIGSALSLAPEMCRVIELASQMHDVGKIGISDRIVFASGDLTEAQRETLQGHCEVGHRLLNGSSSHLLEIASIIALSHHERFDGSGYPYGIEGTQIPLVGRIAAIADVFDALTTERPYRKAFGFPQAIQMMKDESGTHFDPRLLDYFLASMDQVIEIFCAFPEIKSDGADSFVD